MLGRAHKDFVYLVNSLFLLLVVVNNTQKESVNNFEKFWVVLEHCEIFDIQQRVLHEIWFLLVNKIMHISFIV